MGTRATAEEYRHVAMELNDAPGPLLHIIVVADWSIAVNRESVYPEQMGSQAWQFLALHFSHRVLTSSSPIHLFISVELNLNVCISACVCVKGGIVGVLSLLDSPTVLTGGQ